eukprot:2493753-Rhodomonas_salina.2
MQTAKQVPDADDSTDNDRPCGKSYGRLEWCSGCQPLPVSMLQQGRGYLASCSPLQILNEVYVVFGVEPAVAESPHRKTHRRIVPTRGKGELLIMRCKRRASRSLKLPNPQSMSALASVALRSAYMDADLLHTVLCESRALATML